MHVGCHELILMYDLQDDLMRNIGSSVCRSSVDQPFCSEKSGGLFSKKKKKIDFEEFSAFNDSNYGSHDLLGDDEIFCGSKARKESIWNGSAFSYIFFTLLLIFDINYGQVPYLLQRIFYM